MNSEAFALLLLRTTYPVLNSIIRDSLNEPTLLNVFALRVPIMSLRNVLYLMSATFSRLRELP